MELEDFLAAGFAKALGVPVDDSLRGYVRDGREAPQGAARLLAWDANSIHAFVFDSTNATGIRGASDVLSKIDEDLRGGEALGLLAEQVLFAGGGSGLAVVAEGEVEGCKRKLHEIFATRTLIATCTAADVKLVAGGEGFDGRVRAVGRALARDRICTGPDAEPAVPFFAERCQVCGRRAAAHSQPRGEEGRERLECEPCYERIEGGKGNVRFQKEPAGFEDIADAQGKGFYAVVYLDGNGIGKTLTRLTSPLEYARFSRAISELLKSSFHKLVEHYKLGDRYQLPICGGDDVVAILPGEAAVPFTRDLMAELERAADAHPSLQESNIGASAGVAIGKVRYPIRHLLTEAEALMKAAKRRVYEKPPETRSALSFAVVTDGSPRSESVEPERWLRKREEMMLSGRPYSLAEFTKFSERLETVRKNQKVGRTQLHALYAQAVLGPRQLRNQVLYQIGRRPEWQKLTGDLAKGDPSVLSDPDACEAQFVPTYGERRTFDIADMIDLLSHWSQPKKETRG